MASSSATLALPFVLGGAVKRGRAHEIARVDRGAASHEKLDQGDVTHPRRARQRHGAEPVACLERRAGVEEPPRKRHAT